MLILSVFFGENSGILILDDSYEKGKEFIERKDGNGFIYVNGMKVSEDHSFAFSYNTRKLNKNSSTGVERERSSMSRHSYRDSITGILKKSDDSILRKMRRYKTEE